MSEINFEKSLKRLEEIVKLVENGSISLDENLKLYEEGVLLAKNCLDTLETAKGKITQIKINADGSSEEDFQWNYQIIF